MTLIDLGNISPYGSGTDESLLRKIDPSLQKPVAELEDIFAKMEPGTQTSDISYRDNIMTSIIYRQSDLLSTILKCIPTVVTDNMRHEIQWGEELSGELDIPEMANADFERAPVSRDTVFLKKWELRWYHTWEQFAYDRAGTMLQEMIRRASEALAKTIDDRGLEIVYQGISNTAASLAPWNGNSLIKNPTYDVSQAENTIFLNAPVQDYEMNNMAILYPAQCRGSMQTEIRDIGGNEQSYASYFNKIGYTIMPTRQPSLFGGATAKYGTRDAALVFVKGGDTARFYTYSGHPKIPFVQIKETGVGIQYTIRRWFEAYVIPNSDSDADNDRIYSVTNVVA